MYHTNGIDHHTYNKNCDGGYTNGIGGTNGACCTNDRLVQMESVLEEQRRLMRRMMKHNGNLRSLWRKYAAAPLEDRYQFCIISTIILSILLYYR